MLNYNCAFADKGLANHGSTVSHVNLGLPDSSRSCGTQTRPGYGAANYRPSCNRAVAVSCAVRILLCISSGHDVCAPAADDVHAGRTSAAGPGHAGYRGRVCSRTSHGRNRWACLFVCLSGSVSCWPNCVSNVVVFFFAALPQNRIVSYSHYHHSTTK